MFDGCGSRSCVNVTIIDDKIAEPITKNRRDKFHVQLTGSDLDNIGLSTDIATVYIKDNDSTSTPVYMYYLYDLHIHMYHPPGCYI